MIEYFVAENAMTSFAQRRMLIVMILIILQMGCNLTSRNMESQLQLMPLTESSGVALQDVLSLPAGGQVCVLPPYHDSVEWESNAVREVNEFLQAKKYRGTEGSWAFLYTEQGEWRIEIISRKSIELSPFNLSSPSQSICGRLDQMRIIKLNINRVKFFQGGSAQ